MSGAADVTGALPVLPALLLALGFPVALLLLTEMLNSAVRRGTRLAPTLRATRNLLLPALAAMLFVTEVWQAPADETASRVVRTLFWVSALYVLLTFLNDAFLAGAGAGTSGERVPKLFRDLARVALVAIGAALIYKNVWQQELGGALTALGLGSIVVGLALQEPLGNIVSGLMLLLERPLALGDWIVADGTTGKVIEINWRSVHIETILHEMRIIPNVVLYKTSFSNLSRPTPARTDTHDVGFSYDHPPGDVKRVLHEILATTPGVVADPAPEVHTLDYGDFSITYRMYFTVARHEDLLPVRDRILSRVWYAARRESLQIPFPIQMQYRPYESPSPRQPGVAEVLDRFPRYRQVREAMLRSLEERKTAAIASGHPAPAPDARIVSWGAGEVIEHAGHPVDRFRLVVEGVVDLFVADADGRQVALAELGPGDFHGAAAVAAGQAGDIRAVARSDVVEVEMDARAMTGWLQGSGGLSAEIGDACDQRRRAAERIRRQHAPPARDP